MDRGIEYTNLDSVVLVERNIQPDWVEKMRLQGVERIIVTFDDAYNKMPDGTHGKPWWDKYHSRLLKALGMVDLLIVPSKTLMDLYQPHCKAVQYIPNFVDDDLWSNLPKKTPELRIGWGGSAEHIESWKALEIGQAIAKVLTERPEWGLFICSSIAPEIARFFPKGMTYAWRPWMTHTEWPQVMSGFTIGLAPLYGQYDQYRSNLKLVEYGMGSVPWIATNYDPYTRVNVFGGITVDNSSWYRALSELMESAGYRQKLAHQGHEWALGFRMSQNVPVYERVIWPE